MISGSSGVYRSDGHVVIERLRHHFPALCLQCGAACAAPAAAAATPGTTPAVRPPVCAACAARQRRIALVVAAAGSATLAAAPAAWFALGETGRLVAGALLLAGLGDLAVAAWLGSRSRGFRPVHEDEQYVWLDHAHPGFLSALPAWHGMTLRELQAQRR